MAENEWAEIDQTTGTPVSDLDHVALTRLMTECVWRVDHGLGNTMYECYTEDGEIWLAGKLIYKGREALIEWGKLRLDPETIRHISVNVRFLQDGGPDRAKGSGVEIVYLAEDQKFGPEATLPLLVGEWEGVCVRTEEGWKFSRTNYQRMFDRRENPGGLF